jgi:TRAP-type C4-dicarboxylate transport system substrate-binding protein
MLFRDEPNAAATVHDPAIQKAMFDLAAPKRMVGIATLDPILRLSDFSGKKLRINGTELERQKMAKLGATGIGMPLINRIAASEVRIRTMKIGSPRMSRIAGRTK